MANAEMERAGTLWREMWPQKDEPTVPEGRDAIDQIAAFTGKHTT
jgi:hypothetical protein